jgi:hypothetical protein
MEPVMSVTLLVVMALAAALLGGIPPAAARESAYDHKSSIGRLDKALDEAVG